MRKLLSVLLWASVLVAPAWGDNVLEQIEQAKQYYADQDYAGAITELQFAVNHLAPFLLTSLLRDRLVADAPARIVVVASRAHERGRVDFDDLQGERDYSGPARVAGSAGTGKTIVALHRAVHLARQNEDARVLLTTFSETLARSLQTLLRRLISNEPRIGERLDVYSMEGVALRLHEVNFGRPQIATESQATAPRGVSMYAPMMRPTAASRNPRIAGS